MPFSPWMNSTLTPAMLSGVALYLQDHLLDVAEAGDVAGRVVEVVRAAVAGGEGDVDPAAHERLDAVVVVGVVRAHGAGAVVAAVEAAQEGDDEGAAGAGGLAHDAHRVLHDLAAGGVVDDLAERLGRDLDQLLGELVLVPGGERREALGAVLLERRVRGLDELGVVAAERRRRPARRASRCSGCRRRPRGTSRRGSARRSGSAASRR